MAAHIRVNCTAVSKPFEVTVNTDRQGAPGHRKASWGGTVAHISLQKGCKPPGSRLAGVADQAAGLEERETGSKVELTQLSGQAPAQRRPGRPRAVDQ